MTLPDTMRAVVLTGHGGLEKLEYREDYPTPVAEAGEAVVRVFACGMNNTDVNTRTGWYSPGVTEGTTAQGGLHGFQAADDDEGAWGGGVQFPRVQGADVCGEVVSVGPGVDTALVGHRVLIETWLRDPEDPLNPDKARYFGSEVDGGYAEYTKAPASNIYPVDSQLTDGELATFATAYITAENMLVQGNVGQGDVVLIPGASGGVGSALIQLVRRRDAIPVAMCGEDKADRVRAIGAEAVLPRATEDLATALFDAIGTREVDVVADVVGGAMWPQFIGCLRRRGRYTCAGAIAGPIVSFDLRAFYLKDLVFTGATVVPPGLFADLVGYIERGEVRPLLAATYPLESMAQAQTAFLEKKHVGNIAILP